MKKLFLITYKKHTGRPSISHKEAICFGWIDTIVRRIDEDRFERGFVKRKNNAM